MQLSDAYLTLGQERFHQLLKHVSIGKLKTYQLFETIKTRAHLGKLNTENLRKAAPRLWTRLSERDEDLAVDLGQGILVSHLPMITAVLDFIGIPHEEGFFSKDVEASKHLTEGWQERVFENFRSTFPEPVLLFYINHLAWEFDKQAEVFAPAGARESL